MQLNGLGLVALVALSRGQISREEATTLQYTGSESCVLPADDALYATGTVTVMVDRNIKNIPNNVRRQTSVIVSEVVTRSAEVETYLGGPFANESMTRTVIRNVSSSTTDAPNVCT